MIILLNIQNESSLNRACLWRESDTCPTRMPYPNGVSVLNKEQNSDYCIPKTVEVWPRRTIKTV